MKNIRSYLLISLGALLVATGICLFFIPANLATGGITGLALVTHKLVPAISIGNALLILNVVLFGIGFLTIGKAFGAKTIYAAALLTGLVYVFDAFVTLDGPIVDDLLVNLIAGILVSGLGLGIVFNQNASTGGTDIIAKVLNKYLNIDIGRSLLMADFVVVTLAAFSFGIELAVYALLGIIMNGFIIDAAIEGFNLKVNVSIISSESVAIQKYIVESLERGATIYTAKGAYTMSDKEIITSVMGKKEFVRLKTHVRALDPKAFVMVSNVREVLGEGFFS
ncbi:YitT family protein [Fusibacter sp. JL298sf-3]